MNLVIVESPTKARKLRSYLGKDFTVEASIGHVRGLPKKNLGIDLENNYQALYEVSSDKKKIVSKLRKLAREAQSIYLAMDPDREGEAIAWHIKYLLENDRQFKKSDSAKRNFLRSTFYEITKPAVLKAIDQPSTINLDLVDAQQARRVLDRLVGYKVSPVLWKKVRRGLSAGRVQSVALRMIVEREREIEAFKSDEYWEFAVALAIPEYFKDSELEKWQKKEAIFSEEQKQIELPKEILLLSVEKVDDKKLKIDNEKAAKKIAEDLGKAKYQVKDLKKIERRRQSLPPFTTSLLQQTAANRFGFSAKQTMSLAQRLYEEGLITYHRTDAFYLATSAVEAARQYITKEFGPDYLPEKARYFSKKNKNSQEAHEAIRVTDLNVTQDNLENVAKLSTSHLKLYDLIWRRFLASQMSEAVYDQTTILVSARPEDQKKEYELKVVGSVMKFPGWRRLFSQKNDLMLPEVKVDQVLTYLAQNPMQKFTQPPARYNDASLIKELEKRGIGRPSTYASIISVIIQRAYVERQDRRFFATAIGTTVSDFLLKHFQVLMDYDFTATIEESLDKIAEGDKAWTKVVDEFYQPLAKRIELATKEAERVAVPVEKTGEACPECAKLVKAGELDEKEAGEVVIRSGRYGKFKSCSRFPDCKYTENLVETLGDQLCPLCQKAQIVIKNTRWGKSFYGCADYPKCQWASWKKPEPDLKLTQAQWEEIQAKREAWKAKRAKSKGESKGKSKSKNKKTAKKTKKQKKTS
ncbi:MAG: type I DNA topoisomerase [Candidatus Pacebacteria bacterium]|nr:type I DNA topoisomerase [Candidatus Paceibacterota bacterium]